MNLSVMVIFSRKFHFAARLVMAGLILAVMSGQVMAKEDEQDSADILTRMPHYYTSYKVNEDYSYSTVADWSLTILDKRSLDDNKQTSISYSTSIEEVEIIHAYTMKKDGRRIDAPKTNYQYQSNSGSGKSSPAFSDRSRITVIFPEVETGDTTFLAYRILTKEPMFPGYFTAEKIYSPSYAYDDARVILDVPKQFKGVYQSRGMKETVDTGGDRIVYTWSYRNPVPTKEQREDYSVWDREEAPGLEYSTFDSYGKIVEAYGKRANQKAAMTPAIQNLADKIVGNENDRRKQARLIYDWVAREVSYAGNCIGVGAVVPRDLSFVIENRMGDCKDHATLLQALLAAKEIKSTQVLVNSGSIYKLPKVPMVSSVNHVINYLPEFNLYVDSTDSDMPFGILGFSVSDKPALHVEGYTEGMRTPSDVPENYQQKMVSNITLSDDGSAKAMITVSLEGRAAAEVRAKFREMTAERKKKLVENFLRSQNLSGSGELTNDDPSGMETVFSYSVNINVDKIINRPGAGAFYIAPMFFSDAPVSRFAQPMNLKAGDKQVACSNGLVSEEYVYTLGNEMKLLAIPANVIVERGGIAYSSTYEQKGNTLSVKRAVRDMTRGNVCDAEIAAQQDAVASKIKSDLFQQVVYQ